MAALQKLRTMMANDAIDVEAVPIPRLLDDLEYAKAAALLAEFNARLERLKVERDGRILENFLATREPRPLSQEDQALRARLGVFLALPPIATAAAPGLHGDVEARSAVILAGMSVLKNMPIDPAPDFAASMARLDRQIDALGAASREQHAVVETIAETLSLKYARELAATVAALDLARYRAAQEFAHAHARILRLFARIRDAGIASNHELLSVVALRSPMMLGDPSQWASELATYRRLLEAKGIV